LTVRPLLPEQTVEQYSCILTELHFAALTSLMR
jgi:hypothetical protein